MAAFPAASLGELKQKIAELVDFSLENQWPILILQASEARLPSHRFSRGTCGMSWGQQRYRAPSSPRIPSPFPSRVSRWQAFYALSVLLFWLFPPSPKLPDASPGGQPKAPAPRRKSRFMLTLMQTHNVILIVWSFLMLQVIGRGGCGSASSDIYY